LNRKQKVETVSDLHQRFVGAKVAILTDFRGLDVDAMNKLRSELRNASVEYRVVKNTLIRLASKDTSIDLLKDHFQGPCAIALCQDDPVLLAKIITKFSKEYPGLNVKAGMVGGRVLSVDEIQELSKLPSREVLLARLVGALCSVPGKFVQTLNGVLIHFLGVLEAIKAKKEA
jgi:large subunit ribosomal protein L10